MRLIRNIASFFTTKRRYLALTNHIIYMCEKANLQKCHTNLNSISDPYMKGYSIGSVETQIELTRELLEFISKNK